MVRGPRREGRKTLARPLAVLLMPLAAFPLLAACAEQSETRTGCDRPISCPEKRPLPILY
jgi:uncharacterized lipoprotein YajG